MTGTAEHPADLRARVAIDLGGESCRVSLLRWVDGEPEVRLVHRLANGPVFDRTAGVNGELRWPLEQILAGLEAGLRKAAAAAPEGIASVAVDGWAVDYVRLGPDGRPEAQPYCYRDIRTEAGKAAADGLIGPGEMFGRTGAQPLRINTVYQLVSDKLAGRATDAKWTMLPEYVLSWLGGRRVAEWTIASHTGLVDGTSREWLPEVFDRLGLEAGAAPEIVEPGTVVGLISGPFASLPAFRDTVLIAPACHDTASAIAAIPYEMRNSAYLVAGTWSLVGTVVEQPICTAEALAGGFTNQGAAVGGWLFHRNVNGMWLVKQCLDHWAGEGRKLDLLELIRQARMLGEPKERLRVDAEQLMLPGRMPERINEELAQDGKATIADDPGNEAVLVRLILSSLAVRYAEVIAELKQLTGRQLERIVVLGGANRNDLLVELTEKATGLTVVLGPAEGSTLGNLALQLAVGEGQELTAGTMRRWAERLSRAAFHNES